MVIFIRKTFHCGGSFAISEVQTVIRMVGRRAKSVRSNVAPLQINAGTLPGKSQPCGNTQITTNGLN